MVTIRRVGTISREGRSVDARRLPAEYVVGFVDGEGCFSVSVHPHPTARYAGRWILAPCFQVAQHQDNRSVLEQLRTHFGCGRITAKGPKTPVLNFSVYRRSDLTGKVIPFFEEHPLRSTKRIDFERFARVVRGMERGEHRTTDGFRTLVEICFSMNKRGKQRRYRLEDVLRNPQRLHAEQSLQVE